MNSVIEAKMFKLYNHPLFKEVSSIEDGRVFMEHHIYAVWDFMSLVKKVQAIFAPIKTPWLPSKHTKYRRFVNEIILAEESDTLLDGRVMSHCEMYLEAMKEIGARTRPFENFIEALQSHGLESSEVEEIVPESALAFMKHTFSVVNSKQAHCIIGAFCYARENVIPGMFQSLLNQSSITDEEAPTFMEYLKKHIELDADEHGPMAIKMVDLACGGRVKYTREVEMIVTHSIQARITFWDGVLDAIKLNRRSNKSCSLEASNR
jgi:pyrroloquinoline quinone (PQQ) biosynthesis protein C